MEEKLSGRRALITGGSSGIGKAIACLFAREGASVVIASRSDENGNAVAGEINAAGGQAVFIRTDVSQEEDCRAAVDKTVQVLGGLDILINNAGIVHHGGIDDLSLEEWDRTMAVNVRSVFMMSKHAIPHLAASPFGGVIANNGSVLSHAGARNFIAYAASKAAILSMTKSMALDLCRQHIRVVCICPGDTDTPSLEDEARQAGIPYEAYVSYSRARRPLGIIGAPEDIALGFLYLVSDDARYITGASLVIDGGGLTAYGMG
jgi:NAD(P)-dependent dehydrogenase (short-subunit alcohol dehydrogenase family)